MPAKSDWTEVVKNRRKLWGETDVFDDASVIEAFAEQWHKFFEVVLSWYPEQSWNSILCVCIEYFGTFDIAPTIDLSPKSLSGCNLKFTELYRKLHGEFPDDAAFGLACKQEEARFVSALMAAWNKVRTEPTIASIVRRRAIPFRVINSDRSDVPPLIDVPSLSEYVA